jgi:putative ABC transport system permease protein
MTATMLERPVPARGGGVPARRAVIRWALRMFRREWRQQLLVLGMLTVAVAATVIGAGVATNTPPPSTAGFGTATASVTFQGNDPHLAAGLASLRKYGAVDVIENEAIDTGSTQQAYLRAQDPHGTYGKPLLRLDSGSYPAGAGQVALTSGLASLYSVHTGGTWQHGGRSFLVTGIVENPDNLLEQFALVAPGQLTAPTQVTVLLDAQPADHNGFAPPPGIGGESTAGTGQPVLTNVPAGGVASFAGQGSGGSISPATIVLAIAVLGMVFVGLVSAAGFTVLAQRRLRALGMISALGATERNVRLVTTANGAFIGVIAAVAGTVLGFAGWLAYRPYLESNIGHRISPVNLPWWAVGAATGLAILTPILAARRPARNIARVPVVAALAGRPAGPKAVHRAVLPGLIFLAAGITCLYFSGGWGGNGGKDTLLLLGGLIGVVVGMFRLAPACIAVLSAAAGSWVPASVRVALRDLVRYRARSGAALAAVSFATFLAMLICVVASVRFSNVLDYAGQNLTTQQLVMHSSDQTPGSSPKALTASQAAALERQMSSWASSVHATSVLPLEDAGATLQQAGRDNNNFSGPLYVATPQLLAQFGIKGVNPDADILSMRPGFSSEPRMQLIYGDLGNPNARPNMASNPVIEEVSGLPSGTSAPNTVITEHAVAKYGLHEDLAGWLVTTPQPLTAQQISAARAIAAAAGVSMESKSGELGEKQIADGATALGMLIALGVLAMSVGLIRSETARDLRTLTAVGASTRTRRTITAATAGALGLLGAVLGAAGAAAAGMAWARTSPAAMFSSVPSLDILLLLVGLPVAAAIGGWLLAGRDPDRIARQPLE